MSAETAAQEVIAMLLAAAMLATQRGVVWAGNWKAWRSTVRVSVLHEKGDLIAAAVTLVSKELHGIRAITERSSVSQRWTPAPDPYPAPLAGREMASRTAG
jgi:hypothetical protein